MTDSVIVAVPRKAVVSLTQALERSTGETWGEQRVKDEFLLPVTRDLCEGTSLLEAEAKVWRQLGLLHEDSDV
ncbi:MAG TPA: hypothetical protein VJA46_12155 [Acidimicrobiia bacterium]|nr:hypothetical protein [Acidimicrobiia bacterium]